MPALITAEFAALRLGVPEGLPLVPVSQAPSVPFQMDSAAKDWDASGRVKSSAEMTALREIEPERWVFIGTGEADEGVVGERRENWGFPQGVLEKLH